MSDLISRSALLKYFQEEKRKIKVDSEKYHIHEEAVAGMEAALRAITNKVNEMPTAYDISKVVEELEENKQWYETHGCNVDLNVGVISATNHAIDVVRKGGVE